MGNADVLVHVLQPKNIPFRLPLTVQLLDVGRPLVVAANVIDEPERLAVRLDFDGLARRLGVDAVPLVATAGRGVADLRAAIVRAAQGGAHAQPIYGNEVGEIIRTLRDSLPGRYRADPKPGTHLLKNDPKCIRRSLPSAIGLQVTS